MKRLLLLLMLASGAHAQYVATAFNAGVAPGSNIIYAGNSYTFTGSATSLTNTYTCFSSSDRLVVIGQSGGSAGGAVFTLTNTGSQTSNVSVAASLFPGSGGGDTIEVWISGCSASSNTYTLGQGSASAMVLTLLEYSGLPASGTGSLSTNSGSASPFTLSGTASQQCMLGIAYISGTASSFNSYTNTSAGFSWRTRTSSNTAHPNNQDSFDNICVNSGAVSFSTNGGTATWNGGLILIPGASATSPNWNPSWSQSNYCNGASCAFNQNVTSGRLVIVGFFSDGGSVSSVTDSLSTTYTLAKTLTTSGGNTAWIYVGVPGSSGADTVTVNGSGLSFHQTAIVEFPNVGQTVSDTGGQNVSSGTMAWTQTVSFAKSIIYMVCGGFHGSTTFSINLSGFTFLQYSNANDAGWNGWLRTTTTASVSPSVTVSTTDGNVCASIVVH